MHLINHYEDVCKYVKEGIDKVHQLAGGNSNTIIGVLLNPTPDI